MTEDEGIAPEVIIEAEKKETNTKIMKLEDIALVLNQNPEEFIKLYHGNIHTWKSHAMKLCESRATDNLRFMSETELFKEDQEKDNYFARNMKILTKVITFLETPSNNWLEVGKCLNDLQGYKPQIATFMKATATYEKLFNDRLLIFLAQASIYHYYNQKLLDTNIFLSDKLSEIVKVTDSIKVQVEKNVG